MENTIETLAVELIDCLKILENCRAARPEGGDLFSRRVEDSFNRKLQKLRAKVTGEPNPFDEPAQQGPQGTGEGGGMSLACRTMGPVHEWFELSYAGYLTVPRSILQSMPIEWQERFATCLEELDDALPWRPVDGRYWVKLKDARGRYTTDPFNDYRHVPAYSAEEVARLRGAKEGGG